MLGQNLHWTEISKDAFRQKEFLVLGFVQLVMEQEAEDKKPTKDPKGKRKKALEFHERRLQACGPIPTEILPHKPFDNNYLRLYTLLPGLDVTRLFISLTAGQVPKNKIMKENS